MPVVVDDWIPCEARGKPAFATSRKGNELWVSILEKAYAKLHGSYEALEGGLVQDALVDLTGGAGEEIDLTNEVSQLDLASGRLWFQLQRFNQEGFLLGAGSPSGSDVHVSSSGIVQNHAYSLLQVSSDLLGVTSSLYISQSLSTPISQWMWIPTLFPNEDNG